MGKKLILATKYFTVGPALHTHAQRTSGIHADCVQTYTYTYTHQIRAFFQSPVQGDPAANSPATTTITAGAAEG